MQNEDKIMEEKVLIDDIQLFKRFWTRTLFFGLSKWAVIRRIFSGKWRNNRRN
jgi:hypothetical protein